MNRLGQMISQRIESQESPRDQTVIHIQGRVKIDFRKLREAASFNHALRRGKPCAIAPASAATFPTAVQALHNTPRSRCLDR